MEKFLSDQMFVMTLQELLWECSMTDSQILRVAEHGTGLCKSLKSVDM